MLAQNMPDRKWRLAVGSYLESSDKNVVEMISCTVTSPPSFLPSFPVGNPSSRVGSLHWPTSSVKLPMCFNFCLSILFKPTQQLAQVDRSGEPPMVEGYLRGCTRKESFARRTWALNWIVVVACLSEVTELWLRMVAVLALALLNAFSSSEILRC